MARAFVVKILSCSARLQQILIHTEITTKMTTKGAEQAGKVVAHRRQTFLLSPWQGGEVCD